MTEPYLDRCIFQAAAGGTVNFVVASTITGYQLPALAGAVDTQVLHYAAQSTDLTQWEVGSGTYSTAGPTLSRDTVLHNSLGTGTLQGGPGTKINFSAAPQVLISALASDIASTGGVTDGDKGDIIVSGGGVTWLLDPTLNKREVVSTARTYYVNNSTGSDSNTGLSSGTAFLTIAKAVNTVCDTLYLTGTASITIQLATTAVDYNEYVRLRPIFGLARGASAPGAALVGDAASSANVVIKPTGALPTSYSVYGIIQASGTGADWSCSQLKVDVSSAIPAGAGLSNYYSDTGSHLYVYDGDLVQAPGCWTFWANERGFIAWYAVTAATSQVSGDCSGGSMFGLGWNSQIICNSKINWTVDPNYYSVVYANVQSQFFYYHNVVFSGTVSGLKYYLHENCTGWSLNADESLIPGSSPGLADVHSRWGDWRFTDFKDTPSSYAGQALKGVRVNAGATGLEFATPTPGGPEIVTADRNYYVATTGSDANDGSVGSPWLTIQHAIDFCQNEIIIENKIKVTINIANGTYNEQPFIGQRLGGGLLWLVGNTSDPTLVIIKPTTSVTYAAAFNFFFNQVFGLGGFTIDCTDAGFGGYGGIYAIGGDFDFFYPVIIKIVTNSGWFGAQFLVDSKVGMGAGVTFDMPGTQAAAISLNDSWMTGGYTITGNPVWGLAGLLLDNNAAFDCSSLTIPGTATGPRAIVLRSSILNQSATDSNTLFPGDAPVQIDPSSAHAGVATVGYSGSLRVAGAPTTANLPLYRTQALIHDTVNNTIGLYFNDDGTLRSISSLTDGDKGDITVTGSGATWTIDNDAVTYAKMQNVSAASKLLGRGSASGAGDPEEITLGTNLSMSGTTLNASGSGASMTLDVIDDILVLTPTSGASAYATDIKQTLLADGTTWLLDSSYSTAVELPDLGGAAWSNRIGYGREYVTDKLIANCTIGDNADTTDGGIRFTADVGEFGAFEMYSSGSWHAVVSGLVLTEQSDLSQAITQTPIGQSQEIVVFNGDSTLLGLNGQPVIQGYKASMGAYPPFQHVDGGTF